MTENNAITGNAILEQLLVKQQQQIDLLTNMLLNNRGTSSIEQLMDKLAAAMETFHYLPDEGSTFAKWYRRYKDVFTEDAKDLDDAAKVRLVLRKLGVLEHNQYLDSILPKEAKDIQFAETIQILTDKFGKAESLFSQRWRCFQLVKERGVDFSAHATVVNRLCEDFELTKLSSNQFKCLIFIFSLQAQEDREIRTRLLSKVDASFSSGNAQDEITLNQLVSEAQRIINIQQDTGLTKENSLSVKAISSKHPRNNQKTFKKESKQTNKAPSTSCWNCGELHYSKFCNYKKHKCTRCHEIGHKEGFCKVINKKSKKFFI